MRWLALRAAFQAFDTDNSGSISKEELTVALMRGAGPNQFSLEEAKHVAEKIIADFDEDSNGQLEFEEFVAWQENKARIKEGPTEDVIAVLKAKDIPVDLVDELAIRNKALLKQLSKAADQLKAVGGNRNRLSVQHHVKERANEEALNQMPYEACEIAAAAGNAAEMCLHDALTLLKAKNFLGFLLRTLGAKSASAHRCVWAAAKIDNFKTISDRWSRAHGDFALILACHAIGEKIARWNAVNGRVGHAVAMRFGGDEIVLAIVLRGNADIDHCRSLVNELQAAVCEKLQARFGFGSLKPPPKDRNGKKIAAKGPSLFIGVSTALPCGKPGVQFANGFVRAADLMNEYEPKWKADERHGKDGGVIFEDDLLGDHEAGRHIAVLKDERAVSEAREKAAAALANLAKNFENEVNIVLAGGLPPLIALLSSGTPLAQEYAAAALFSLSFNADNKVVIAQARGVSPLIALLSSGTSTASEEAVGTLLNLAANPDIKDEIRSAGGLPPLVALLASGTPMAKQKAAAALKMLFAKDDSFSRQRSNSSEAETGSNSNSSIQAASPTTQAEVERVSARTRGWLAPKLLIAAARRTIRRHA